MTKNEGPIWKYLKLWTIVFVIVSGIGAYAIMSDNIKDLRAAQLTQERTISNNDARQTGRFEGNREEIELLKQQGIRVEGQLERVNDKLSDQKEDIGNILAILRERGSSR